MRNKFPGFLFWVFLSLFFLSGCQKLPGGPSQLSGGTGTVFDETIRAFSFSFRGLTSAEEKEFFQGARLFNQDQKKITGPFFHSRSCLGCHFMDGRGGPPAPGQAAHSLVLKLGLPESGPHGESLPEPHYGDTLSPFQVPGPSSDEVATRTQGREASTVSGQTRQRSERPAEFPSDTTLPQNNPGEGKLYVAYEETSGKYADGTVFNLRKPRYQVRELGQEALSVNAALSPRAAPSLIGLGLLESIPEKAILQNATQNSHEGISGKPNRVWDPIRQKKSLGRFGWKAGETSVASQTARALHADLGVTTKVFPGINATAFQIKPDNLKKQSENPNPDMDDDSFRTLVFYTRHLAVPARRFTTNAAAREKLFLGENLFQEIQCSLCHTPAWRTGHGFGKLANQTIHPYTDLLLHDMGPGLADGLPEFEANENEWRTPPLWGLGLIPEVNGHTNLLHDGRARGVAEAILWHGGEAYESKESFRNLSARERDALVAFVMSL